MESESGFGNVRCLRHKIIRIAARINEMQEIRGVLGGFKSAFMRHFVEKKYLQKMSFEIHCGTAGNSHTKNWENFQFKFKFLTQRLTYLPHIPQSAITGAKTSLGFLIKPIWNLSLRSQKVPWINISEQPKNYFHNNSISPSVLRFLPPTIPYNYNWSDKINTECGGALFVSL